MVVPPFKPHKRIAYVVKGTLCCAAHAAGGDSGTRTRKSEDGGF